MSNSNNLEIPPNLMSQVSSETKKRMRPRSTKKMKKSPKNKHQTQNFEIARPILSKTTQESLIETISELCVIPSFKSYLKENSSKDSVKRARKMVTRVAKEATPQLLFLILEGLSSLRFNISARCLVTKSWSYFCKDPYRKNPTCFSRILLTSSSST